MNRLFTFGCSFTNYQWPTWADILLYNGEGKNLGLSGSGNESILFRLMEAHRKYEIGGDDTVIIMFTTPIRWDIIGGEIPEFISYGQVTNVDKLKKYENELYSVEGLSFKSYYSIVAIKNYLENNGIKYYFTSLNNIFEDVDNYFVDLRISNELKDLMIYVKNDVRFEIPSMYSFLEKRKIIKNRSWGITKKWYGYYDYHPRPIHHFQYVKEEILPKIGNIDIIEEDEVKKMETIIDRFEDIKEYLDYNTKEYPSIYNKKEGPMIYMKSLKRKLL